MILEGQDTCKFSLKTGKIYLVLVGDFFWMCMLVSKYYFLSNSFKEPLRPSQ